MQRKWYRNFLMKGFHLVVLLAAGPGIRDTQVIAYFINFWPCFLISVPCYLVLHWFLNGFAWACIFDVGFYLSDLDFARSQCGFKMFTRAAARKLFSNVRLKRWLFLALYKCNIFINFVRELLHNWEIIENWFFLPYFFINCLDNLYLFVVIFCHYFSASSCHV